MQTFMPYSNVLKSIYCLDNKRLGKQRVEAMQILNILTNKTQSKAWRNHPAVLMWQGYEDALRIYMNHCILHWIDRGFKNTMKLDWPDQPYAELPFWIGNRLFHNSHKSNLLRKDQSFYSQYQWQVKLDLPYYWPVQKGN
jgi:hypothetical protein